MTQSQELQDAMASNESRPAGNQNHAHRCHLIVEKEPDNEDIRPNERKQRERVNGRHTVSVLAISSRIAIDCVARAARISCVVLETDLLNAGWALNCRHRDFVTSCRLICFAMTIATTMPAARGSSPAREPRDDAGVNTSGQTRSSAAQQSGDPLPSWNEGSAKKSIIAFVARVTTEGRPDFVPTSARIATFDNDGTLWCEQPIYVQAAFAFHRATSWPPRTRP